MSSVSGVQGLTRAMRMWARPSPPSTRPESNWGTSGWGSWFGGWAGTPSFAPFDYPAPNDLSSFPYLVLPVSGVNIERTDTTFDNWFQRGTGAGRGGGRAVWQFGFDPVTTSTRWFIGFSLAGLISSPGTAISTEPSALVNMVGIGQNSADSSPQFMHNDGSGTATKVSTGLSDVQNFILYEVTIFADPFATGIDMEFKRYDGGIVTESANYHASTNLPVVVLPAWMMINAGPSGADAGLAFISFFGDIQPWPIDS